MNLSMSEQLCYSTVRIECRNESGQTSTGSGFFFRFKKSENEILPIIITNKHVVAGMTAATFTMTTANEDDSPNNKNHFPVTLLNLQTFIKRHPDDDVDLCALPLAPILHYADQNNIRIFYRTFQINMLPTVAQLNDFTALEDILMIGYPNGIWDEVNNMPMLRRGSTATHPCLDYNGRKEFMIDAACFPGSSGSPVLIYNASGYITKTGNVIMGSIRAILVGILYAGPQYTAKGEIKVVTVPTVQQPVTISKIFINLGLVIKSERILELERLFL